MVEGSGGRMFGLDPAEVQNRRQYVERVRREIEVRVVDIHIHEPVLSHDLLQV